MRRIMLFISSYVPLYILLVVKNVLERCTTGGRFTLNIEQFKTLHLFDEVNDFAITALLLMSIITIAYLKILLNKSGDSHHYTIEKIEDQTGTVYFNYISIYLLSCLGLTLSSIVDVFVLLFLMVIVGYIYISNHMTYMNPTLQFLGYKVYEGTLYSDSTKKHIQSIVIAPKNVPVKEKFEYLGSGKEDFVFITAAKD